MIQVKVRGIAFDQKQNLPAVILTDHSETRYIPIFIGPSEATSILLKLNEEKISRPMTHDLFKMVLDSVNVGITQIVINDVKDNTFYAQIFLSGKKEGEYIDARPSDAIALALRMGAPIFVSEKVILDASIEDKDKTKSDAKEFKQFLDGVTAQDFLAESLKVSEDSKGQAPDPLHQKGPSQAGQKSAASAAEDIQAEDEEGGDTAQA